LKFPTLLLPFCRDRVARIADGGAILITWANHHYLDFAINWLNHMHQLNITSYMIGAMDDDLLQVNWTFSDTVV
jgi:hypothetical protein